MTQAGAAATLALGLSIAFASAGWAADQDLKGFDCIIEPNQMVELGSPVPGVIDEMLVDRGDKVAKGQLVARLKSDLEQAAVNLAQAQANYNAEVASAKAQHDFAARKADRTEELFAKKAVPFHVKDEADTEQVLAAMELQQARQNHHIARLQLAHAEQNLRLRSMISPIDGVVMERRMSPGERIEDQPAMVLAEIDPLRVEVIIPVEYLGSIEPGMQALIVPEVPKDQQYRGAVSLVDPVADAASGTFGVRVELPNPKGTIAAGVGCRVSFSDSSGLAASP